MGPGPKWGQGPNGARAQMGPGPQWGQGPNGPRGQVGSGPKWAQGPSGPGPMNCQTFPWWVSRKVCSRKQNRHGHVVIDDFLPKAMADAMLGELPERDLCEVVAKCAAGLGPTRTPLRGGCTLDHGSRFLQFFGSLTDSRSAHVLDQGCFRSVGSVPEGFGIFGFLGSRAPAHGPGP